ncbi:hypothetical protein HK101_007894 [Irineochytrium annulatum]|nr:hypothetical protein HK101_007894 [Irineochytrium annulatum]
MYFLGEFKELRANLEEIIENYGESDIGVTAISDYNIELCSALIELAETAGVDELYSKAAPGSPVRHATV